MAKSSFNQNIEKTSLIDFSVNELMGIIEEAKIDLQKKFKLCTANYFKKAFDLLDLKKDFLSYAKSLVGIDEKEICVCFMENHISELLKNLDRWSSIFKTEEEDKVNRKHRKHRKNFMIYVGKIRVIYFIFHFSLKKIS